MPFGLRRRYLALPLRAKLTIWNTLVVLFVASVALVAVRTGLRWMLLKELEIALQDEVYETSLTASRPAATSEQVFDDMERTSAGHIRHGWFLQLFDADGRALLWSSENTPAPFRRPPFHLDASALDLDGVSYRLAQRRLPARDRSRAASPSGAPYHVRIGTSLEFIREDVANVTRIITPVLLGVFLLAPIGGYILAGRATAPLQKLIATSRALHPSRLNERLPLRHTGDELDQLSLEINQFLDQIAEHLQRNREFVANAAHELRSPLSAMITSIDVALGRDRSLAQYQDLLTTIHDECRQLGTLVNQLLLLAESDAGLLGQQKSPVRFDEVVRSSADMFAGVAEEQHLELRGDIEPGVTVVGDTTRLRQVVNNLIDNAVKFTPAGGRVEVTLRSDVGGERALLTVRDSGVGIPPPDLPHVFDRFYQVERSRHHDSVVHGTGLGLSICRAVVLAYGGTIQVESALGVGTLFTVSFPSAASPPRPAASVPLATRAVT
jgi:heavy metal sensor kinase